MNELKLTDQDIQVIMFYLQKAPYEAVAQTIFNISSQIKKEEKAV